jgi:hypothetical protein
LRERLPRTDVVFRVVKSAAVFLYRCSDCIERTRCRYRSPLWPCFPPVCHSLAGNGNDVLVSLDGRCSGFYWYWHCFHINTHSFDQISNKTKLEISINRNSFDQISSNANNVIHSARSSFDQIPQNATSRLPSIPHNDFNPDLGSELVHFICIQEFFLN